MIRAFYHPQLSRPYTVVDDATGDALCCMAEQTQHEFLIVPQAFVKAGPHLGKEISLNEVPSIVQKFARSYFNVQDEPS